MSCYEYLMKHRPRDWPFWLRTS